MGLGVVAAVASVLVSDPDPPTADRTPDTGRSAAAPESQREALFDSTKIALRPVPIDAAKLEAARSRLLRGPTPEAADTSRLTTALLELGRAERTGAEPKVQRAAQHAFSVQLTQIYAISGPRGAQELEAAIWKEFRKALMTVSEAARKRGEIVEALAPTTGTELDPALDRVGSFLTLGRQIGLFNRWGKVAEDDWPVVRLAHRVRFFASYAGAVNPDELLAPEEVRTFYLWRLHNAPVTDAALRARWAETMARRVDGYPSAVALVVVLHQDGQKDKVQAALETARELHPEHAKLLDAWATLLDKPAPP